MLREWWPVMIPVILVTIIYLADLLGRK